MKARSFSLASVVALGLTGGCYSGVASFEPQGEGIHLPGASSDGDDDPLSESFVPDAAQIRLLSAHEYASTIEDLLGVEASSQLVFGEVGSGYDNGSAGQLGESLFSVLQVESARVAAAYVETGLAQSFPCFDPGVAMSDACVESIVDQLGRRAFRRPLDLETRQQLLDFVGEVTPLAEGSREVAELLVTRILMSPQFLYRTEVGQALPDDPSMAKLDAFERAALLSYSLVGSMPDEPLLADAEADALDIPRIREHVRRLLASERGRRQMVRFFKQWLRVTELDAMAADFDRYPKLASAEQARALRGELELFIERVVLDDEGTLGELLTRNITYVDRHTAPLYGASSDSDELEPLILDSARRGGVLTLASVMAVHSSSSEVHRDKPIRRGLLVKNQLLCDEVGLPSGIDIQSAAAGVMDDVPDYDELTTRDQLELIMNQDEVCVSCHSTFMPYGYLWSNFDALGQYQTHMGDQVLDALVDDLQVDGQTRSYDGVMDMLPDLVESEQVSRCFGRNMARYATGHAQGSLVGFLTDELTDELVAGDLEIPLLIEDIFATPELYIRGVQ